MSSSGVPLRTVSSRFNSLGFWADCMNTQIGAIHWYLGGCCAAFLHIDGYEDKDASDYAARRMQIFPPVIEIGVEEARAADLEQRYGEMVVQLGGTWLRVVVYPESGALLSSQKRNCGILTLPPRSTPLLIYTPESLIQAYAVTGGPHPSGRRQLRIAMLRLMVQRGHIDRTTIEREAAVPVAAGV